jgi:RNA recognition motif-containing protein
MSLEGIPVIVFFEGVPSSYTTSDVQELFAQFGTVKSTFLVTRRSGQSLCFGQVTFSSLCEARQAVGSLNGRAILGKVLKASIANADHDPERAS